MSLEFAGAEGSASVPEKTLHPYQQDMMGAILDARNNWVERTYIDSATGTGKDFVIAQTVKHFVELNPSERTLYLAHNRFVLNEAAKEIAEANSSITQGRMFGGEFQDQEQITFATFQTLNRPLGAGRAYEAYDPEEYDLVIVNESHHAPADTYRRVIEYYRPELLLGATATAERRDQQDIKEIFGEPAYTLKLEEAIAKGYLVRPDYHVLTDHVHHLDEFSGKLEGDISYKDLQEINGNVLVPQRDEEIIDTVVEYIKNIDKPRPLFFCGSIAHAEHYNQLLNERMPGMASTMHSDLTDKEQDARMKAFRSGETPGLFVVDMFNEAVDVPEINVVVFLRSTESKTVFFQQLGRGLRKIAGKDTVTILDFVANWERLSTLQRLQSNIKRHRQRGPRELREISADISFNFSPEAMEAVKVVEEARERERLRAPKPKETPRLDKWAAEDTELQEMLRLEKLPARKRLSANQWDQLAERLAKGDKSVVEEIVLTALPKAYGTAKNYAARIDSNELTLEDHFHHAVEGIYDGMRRYKPDKGSSLRTRVEFGVYATMSRLAKNRGLIRIPIHVQDMSERIDKAREKLIPELGSIVLLGEKEFDERISDVSGIDPEAIDNMRQLEELVGYENLLPVEALNDKPDDSVIAPDTYAINTFNREKMKEALEELSYRERRTLELRYGLGGEAPQTIDEVGRVFNVTRERIRQIENQSLKKLQLMPAAQHLRSELDTGPYKPSRGRQRLEQQQEAQRQLERMASSALRGPLSYGDTLQQIADEAGLSIAGVSQAAMRALSSLASYAPSSRYIEKKSLLDYIEKVVLREESGSLKAVGLSYNDYINTLNKMEEHGLIHTTRNERGTIIESVALAVRIGF